MKTRESRFLMPTHSILRLAAALLAPVTALTAGAQPTAKAPYTVTVFAAAPAGLTNPDSITEGGGSIFVTYANTSQPDGSGGPSTIVQYDPTGRIVRTFVVSGKNDGLKYNPFTRRLWALRNEDANPALTIIDPQTGAREHYTYAQPPSHGGGYDDVVFLQGHTFISASNPTVLPSTPTTPNGQNVHPSVVEARLSGHQITVSPVLKGNDPLSNVVTGKTDRSQQSDPDSLKVDAAGDLVLDSQADGDLIFINAPGSPQQASLLLHLTNGTAKQITVDDTVFPTAPSGTVLVVDTKADTVYAVHSNAFQPGGAYSASDSDGILGKVDLSTGFVNPIVTGMRSPHGALFIPDYPEVSIQRGAGLSFQGSTLTAAFLVTRLGDVSQALGIRYSVHAIASETNDDQSFTGTIEIPAGQSGQAFNVPITSVSELAEDGVTQSALIILEPGPGYNLGPSATAAVDLAKGG
ncbi:MAG TPA: hypothetical protein VGD78_02260 [Chthoniobacterales bacterium]